MAGKIKGNPVMQLLKLDLITPESENWAKERSDPQKTGASVQREYVLQIPAWAPLFISLWKEEN